MVQRHGVRVRAKARVWAGSGKGIGKGKGKGIGRSNCTATGNVVGRSMWGNATVDFLFYAVDYIPIH